MREAHVFADAAIAVGLWFLDAEVAQQHHGQFKHALVTLGEYKHTDSKQGWLRVCDGCSHTDRWGGNTQVDVFHVPEQDTAKRQSASWFPYCLYQSMRGHLPASADSGERYMQAAEKLKPPE